MAKSSQIVKRPEEGKTVHSNPRRRDKNINLESLKTLVIAFGPREAARQAGMKENTVLSIARRKKWKRNTTANGITPIAISPLSPVASNGAVLNPNEIGQHNGLCTLPPADSLARVLENLRTRSTHGLSTYCARASDELAKVDGPMLIAVAGKAKEIADVHRSMWPHEQKRNDILQVGILIQVPAGKPENTQVIDV